MTTTDIITAEVERMRESGVTALSRDHGQFIRAAKAYEDCVVMIQKFGPLPEDFCHAGWPWGRHEWNPNRFNAQANTVKAAALLVLEVERANEQADAARALHRQAVPA